METIASVRLKEEDLVFLEKFSKEENETKGKLLRELIENGRIMTAILFYKDNKASVGKAAEIAGVTISEFIDTLSEFGISSNITLQDYKESIQNLRGIIKKH